MRNAIVLTIIFACLLLITTFGEAKEPPASKYIGVKACSMCHKAEKTGNQFSVWRKSKHAEAFKELATPKAAEVAKAKGLTKPASESAECLQCHTIVADAAQIEKTFDAKDGVQCEVCHGPGSAYKTMPIMKDKAKAAAAGLILYKDDAAIEAKCKTCHNEKSPTFKEFKFKDAWVKIKHSKPKS